MDSQYIDYYVKTINLFDNPHGKQYVLKEINDQRKTLMINGVKAPDILILSPLAYEQIIKIECERIGSAVTPTEFWGMKIQVIGDMEGMYIKEIFSDPWEEFIRGKHLRR